MRVPSISFRLIAYLAFSLYCFDDHTSITCSLLPHHHLSSPNISSTPFRLCSSYHHRVISTSPSHPLFDLHTTNIHFGMNGILISKDSGDTLKLTYEALLRQLAFPAIENSDITSQLLPKSKIRVDDASTLCRVPPRRAILMAPCRQRS